MRLEYILVTFLVLLYPINAAPIPVEGEVVITELESVGKKLGTTVLENAKKPSTARLHKVSDLFVGSKSHLHPGTDTPSNSAFAHSQPVHPDPASIHAPHTEHLPTNQPVKLNGGLEHTPVPAPNDNVAHLPSGHTTTPPNKALEHTPPDHHVTTSAGDKDNVFSGDSKDSTVGPNESTPKSPITEGASKGPKRGVKFSMVDEIKPFDGEEAAAKLSTKSSLMVMAEPHVDGDGTPGSHAPAHNAEPGSAGAANNDVTRLKAKMTAAEARRDRWRLAAKIAVPSIAVAAGAGATAGYFLGGEPNLDKFATFGKVDNEKS
ncbi:hypothetical protein FRB95_006208 [Tulasnella sp. JGI-2019a]|nr:hypothetical protein FRB95_006208 [Tulasnella sp. JGI-2019a]